MQAISSSSKSGNSNRAKSSSKDSSLENFSLKSKVPPEHTKEESIGRSATKKQDKHKEADENNTHKNIIKRKIKKDASREAIFSKEKKHSSKYRSQINEADFLQKVAKRTSNQAHNVAVISKKAKKDDVPEPVVRLTDNFFTELLNNPNEAEHQPTLQILRIRELKTKLFGFRVELSDGSTKNGNCVTDNQLGEKIETDQLKEENVFMVLKILNYSLSEKKTFIINDYEIVEKTKQIIGNPNPCIFPQASSETKEDIKTQIIKEDMKTETTNVSKEKIFNEYEELSPFVDIIFRIIGVVTSISPIRDITPRGVPSKLFSFILTNTSGKNMKITCFGDVAVTHNNVIKQGHTFVVTFTKHCIKPVNKKFNFTNQSYEIVLNNDSKVEESNEFCVEFPKLVLKRVPFDQLNQHIDKQVDILSIVDNVQDSVNIKTKNLTECSKRIVELIDETGTIVNLVLFADNAEKFCAKKGDIYAIQNTSVRQYNGNISLSCSPESRAEVNFESSETEDLKNWYNMHRTSLIPKSISAANFLDNLRAFSTLTDPAFVQDNCAVRFLTSTAQITEIRNDTAIYMACPSAGCNKKVREQDGKYVCNKCGKNYDGFEYKFLLNMELNDGISTLWVTLFDPNAQALFGITAKEIMELKNTDLAAYKAYFDAVMYQTLTFDCRAKREIYNDAFKTSVQVVSFKPPTNHIEYNLALDAAIKKLEDSATFSNNG